MYGSPMSLPSINVNTALNQQGGQTQSQGMQLSLPMVGPITLPQTQVSAAVIRSPNQTANIAPAIRIMVV